MDGRQSVAVNGADMMRGASGGSVGKRFRLVLTLACFLAGAAQARDADFDRDLERGGLVESNMGMWPIGGGHVCAHSY